MNSKDETALEAARNRVLEEEARALEVEKAMYHTDYCKRCGSKWHTDCYDQDEDHDGHRRSRGILIALLLGLLTWVAIIAFNLHWKGL